MKHYGIWCAAFLSLAIAPQALCQSERSGSECAADQSQTDRADPPRFWSTFADDLKSGGKGSLMVGIDPGTFRMGCVSGFRCGDNVPVQDVAITRPFGDVRLRSDRSGISEIRGSNGLCDRRRARCSTMAGRQTARSSGGDFHIENEAPLHGLFRRAPAGHKERNLCAGHDRETPDLEAAGV